MLLRLTYHNKYYCSEHPGELSKAMFNCFTNKVINLKDGKKLSMS